MSLGYTSIEAVVNEHVVSSNLYAKRGIKIRRRKKMSGKKALDIHVGNVNAAAGNAGNNAGPKTGYNANATDEIAEEKIGSNINEKGGRKNDDESDDDDDMNSVVSVKRC